MKRIISLFIAPFLSGCFGLTVGTMGSVDHAKEKFEIIKGKNSTGLGINSKTYSIEEVKSLWGEPDKTYLYKNCEVMEYNDGLVWSGLTSYIIVVPIPIAIPTGYSKNIIYFRDGQSVVKISNYTEETSSLGYMCGEIKCGFLFGRVNMFTHYALPPSKIEITWCE